VGDVGRQIDALGILLTGGATNANPDSSLGGAVSSTRVRGLGHIVSNQVPSIRIDNVFPACGEGDAALAVDSSDDLVFTEPSGSAGTPVTIAEGESKIVVGSDINKAVRVYREAGLVHYGDSDLELLEALNGVLAMSNVSNAQRVAGVTTYRALMFYAQGDYGVLDIRLWMPAVGGAQATFSLGLETPSGGAIQSIPNETTAPTAVSFSTPVNEGSALTIPVIHPGGYMGLWIRRVFPAAGTMNRREDFQLAMKYKGA